MRRALQVKPSVERASMTRRIRPTFLLRLVTLAISVGIWVAIAGAATSSPLRVGTLIVLLLGWFVGLEFGVLPSLLERVGAWAYDQQVDATRSIWFIDLDAEERREKERLREATSGNPSLQ